MSLTCVYPRHFYTCPLRLLHGELGEPRESAGALALEGWREVTPDWGE